MAMGNTFYPGSFKIKDNLMSKEALSIKPNQEEGDVSPYN